MGNKVIGTNPGPVAGKAAPIMAESDSDPVVVKSGAAGAPQASAHAVRVTRVAGIMVLTALAVLWMLGGVVFRNANL